MAEQSSGGIPGSEMAKILFARKKSPSLEISSPNGTFTPLSSQKEDANGTDNRGFRSLGADPGSVNTGGFVTLTGMSPLRRGHPSELPKLSRSIDTANSEEVVDVHDVFLSLNSRVPLVVPEDRLLVRNSKEGIINRDSIFAIRTSFIGAHLARLKGILPSTGLAVDLGCGAGMGAIALAERGWGTIGIDIDFSGNEIPYAAQKAGNEGLKTGLVKGGSELAIPQSGELLFVQGDARDSLRIPSNTADLVTSFFTAGPLGVHEDPWKKIYGEGLRVLKEGGLMLVTTEQEQQIHTIMNFLATLGFNNLSVAEIPAVFDRYAITGSK